MHQVLENSAPDPDWEKLRPVLDDAMDHLNGRDREALLLRFFEGRSLVEVGRGLDVTEEAARKRVDRALDRLRALLVKRGVGSTTGAMALMLANQTVVAAPATFASAVAASAISVPSGAAISWGGILQFMNTAKVGAGLAGMVLVLMVGVATYEGNVRRVPDAALDSAKRDLNSLNAQRRELEQLALAGASELIRLQKTLDDAGAAQGAAARARAASEAQVVKEADAWNPMAEGKAFVARHPQVRQALLDFQNAKVDFKYAGLYRARSLTAEQIEQFRALMREASPTPWNINGVGKMLLLSTGESLPFAEVGPRLVALLGEDGIREMMKVQNTTFGRDFAIKIAANLHFTDSPLSKEQTDALTGIINNHRSIKLPSGARAVDWNAASAEARRALSEAQRPAFETVRAQDEAYQAMAAQSEK